MNINSLNENMIIQNSNSKSRYTNKLYNQPTNDKNLAKFIQYLDYKLQREQTRENHLRGGICPKHHIYLNYQHRCDMCD